MSQSGTKCQKCQKMLETQNVKNVTKCHKMSQNDGNTNVECVVVTQRNKDRL